MAEIDIGAGPSAPNVETYPEARADGSVWEVTYNRDTGQYTDRQVVPPAPPRESAQEAGGGGGGGGRMPGMAAPLPQGPLPQGGGRGEPPPAGPTGGSEDGPSTYETAQEGRPQRRGRAQGRPAYYQPQAPTVYALPETSWYNESDQPTFGYAPQGTAGGSKPAYGMGPNSFYQPYTLQPNIGAAAEHQYGPPTPGASSAASGAGGTSGPASPGGPSGEQARQAAHDAWLERRGVNGPGTTQPTWVQTAEGNWSTSDGKFQKYYQRNADGSVSAVVYDVANNKFVTEQIKPPTAGGGAGGGAGTGNAAPGSGNAGDPRSPAGVVPVSYAQLSSPLDQKWVKEFTRIHQGMDPASFYLQPNNWKDPNFFEKNGRNPTKEEALGWALADRAWGQAIFDERGFAPTLSDWWDHWANERRTGKVEGPRPGMTSGSNGYRGGPGDLGGRGGPGPGAGPGAPGWMEAWGIENYLNNRYHYGGA